MTALLAAVNAGDPAAAEQLAAAVYRDLRAMARRRLTQDFGQDLPGVTLQPTALADDTLMILIRQRQRFDNAGHVFAIASRVMMRVLTDYHRSRRARKRGGGSTGVRVSLDPAQLGHDVASHRDDPAAAGGAADVEALSAAMDKLAALDARKADVVRYRVLWGLTSAETADALGIAVATVERDWAFSRAWLARELGDIGG